MSAGFVKSAGGGANGPRSNASLCLTNFVGLQGSGVRTRESVGVGGSREVAPHSSRPGGLPTVGGRDGLDELPEGPLVTRKIVRCSGPDFEDSDPSHATCLKKAEYLLSFPVIGGNGGERVDYMKKILAELRESNNIADKARPVLLMISLSGIKVCSIEGESIYMAHALKRISYATCRPEHCLFSFLAREPKANGLLQYCHAFVTKTPEEATVLNSIVAQAFTIAYANKQVDSEKQSLTFHDVIQNQLEAFRGQFEENSKQKQDILAKNLSQISTPPAQQHKERRRHKEPEDSEHQKPGNEQLRFQSQISGENSPTFGSPAVFMKAVMSLNLDSCPDVNQRAVDTISRILESLNSGEARAHGSPVTILKDTIDTHFRNGLSCAFDRSLLDSFEGDLSPFSPVSSSSLMCQTNDDDNSFHATIAQTGESSNVFPLKPSSKSSHSGCADSPVLSKWPHEQKHSKQLQGLEAVAVTTDASKLGGRMPDMRDEVEICDGNLQNCVWYKLGIAREVVLDMLSHREPGSFFVRDSLTHPGCHALSIKLHVPDSCTSSDIAHYLITKTPRRTFKLKGLSKEWNSLTALVTHLTVMKEILPCLLVLPNSNAFRNSPPSHRQEQSQC